MPTITSVMKTFFMYVDGPIRIQGRPKKTWMEVARIDLKMCNVSEDLAQNIPDWRSRIHVINLNMVGIKL